MEGLRENTIGFDSLDLGTNQTSAILDDDGGALEIEMSLDLHKTTAERAGLHVHATSDGHYTAIVFDAQIGGVVIDRQNVANGDKGYRVAKLSDAELAAGTLDLRVFIDRGCVEVYVNGGKHAMSSYSFWRWRTRRRTRERIRYHAHRHPHHALAQVHRTRVNERSTVPAAGHRHRLVPRRCSSWAHAHRMAYTVAVAMHKHGRVNFSGRSAVDSSPCCLKPATSQRHTRRK